MNDFLDFSIERFAELSALFKARGEEALPAEVRNRWGDIARALNERIAADLGAGSGRLAITFASVYRPALAALRASPVTPSASREEPAVTVDPAMPTFLLSGRSAAVLEAPSHATEPEDSLDATREIDEGKAALPAVPFRAGVSAAFPVADDSDFDARRPTRNTGTVDVDQSALRGAIFPFQAKPRIVAQPSGTSASSKGRLTLEAFASLRAELACARAPVAEILARYGVADRDFDAVCEDWQEVLAADVRIRAHFDALVTEYVDFLRRSR